MTSGPFPNQERPLPYGYCISLPIVNLGGRPGGGVQDTCPRTAEEPLPFLLAPQQQWGSLCTSTKGRKEDPGSWIWLAEDEKNVFPLGWTFLLIFFILQ